MNDLKLLEEAHKLLGHCEGENQLWAYHDELGGQTLEEGTETLILDHGLEDGHARSLVSEMP